MGKNTLNFVEIIEMWVPVLQTVPLLFSNYTDNFDVDWVKFVALFLHFFKTMI